MSNLKEEMPLLAWDKIIERYEGQYLILQDYTLKNGVPVSARVGGYTPNVVEHLGVAPILRDIDVDIFCICASDDFSMCIKDDRCVCTWYSSDQKKLKVSEAVSKYGKFYIFLTEVSELDGDYEGKLFAVTGDYEDATAIEKSLLDSAISYVKVIQDDSSEMYRRV